jgi:hypothetical protein
MYKWMHISLQIVASLLLKGQIIADLLDISSCTMYM